MCLLKLTKHLTINDRQKFELVMWKILPQNKQKITTLLLAINSTHNIFHNIFFITRLLWQLLSKRNRPLVCHRTIYFQNVTLISDFIALSFYCKDSFQKYLQEYFGFCYVTRELMLKVPSPKNNDFIKCWSYKSVIIKKEPASNHQQAYLQVQSQDYPPPP